MKIEIKNKETFVFMVLVALVLGIGLVIGFGGTAPSTMGHSTGEIDWSETIEDDVTIEGDFKIVDGTDPPNDEIFSIIKTNDDKDLFMNGNATINGQLATGNGIGQNALLADGNVKIQNGGLTIGSSTEPAAGELLIDIKYKSCSGKGLQHCDCDSGYIILSGGAHCEKAAHHLVNNHPDPSAPLTQWTARCYYSTSDRTTNIELVCAKIGDVDGSLS